MKIKLFIFNKFTHSPEEFEKLVQAFVAENSNVTGVKCWETGNDSLVVQLTLGVARSTQQEFSLMSGIMLNIADELINNTFEAVSVSGKEVTHFDVTTSNKSPRVFLAMIVEQRESGLNAEPNETQDNPEAQEAATEQDQEAPTSSDTGTEPSKLPGNRKPSQRKTKRNN